MVSRSSQSTPSPLKSTRSLQCTPPKRAGNSYHVNVSGKKNKLVQLSVGKQGKAFHKVDAALMGMSNILKHQALKDLRVRMREWFRTWCNKENELEPEEDVSDADESVHGLEICDEGQHEGSPTVGGQPWKKPRLSTTSVEIPSERPGDGYPEHVWSQQRQLAPGQKGFVNEARSFLSAASTWTHPSLGRIELLPQQRNVALLMHPMSPIERLLVDHNTGSGKTLLMLRVLDNYYFDERPKIAIFPKDSVCDNFYTSLLEWPSRWRDYFACRCPTEASIAANSPSWTSRRFEKWDLSLGNRALKKIADEAPTGTTLQKLIKNKFVVKVRAALEMKQAFRDGKLQSSFTQAFWETQSEADRVHPPAAPLRAYRFTSAGGRAAAVEKGIPRGCVFKIGFDPAEGNPYSRKVVVMDEGHHLTRPHPQYEEQLSNLRNFVYTAKNTVFALCTGTMAEDSIESSRALLDIVKGKWNESAEDEGFLSSHHVRGAAFPREIPAGVSDGALTAATEDELVHRTALRGEALARYMFQEKRFRRLGIKGLRLDARLANYANLYCFAGSFGHRNCKSLVMDETAEYAPKLAEIVELAAASALKHEKVAVMISRRHGYGALLELLRRRGVADGFKVAELTALADFNGQKNSTGERYAVLLANSDEATEGIEFKCVRLHILVGVPSSHAAYVQRASRSVRCGGHSDLPAEDRSVRFVICVAELPDYAQTEIGAFVLWALFGFWSQANPRTYKTKKSEPSAQLVEEAAEKVVAIFEDEGISDLADLSQRALTIHNIMDDLDIPAKLKARFLRALHIAALDCESGKFCLPTQATLTADERALERLRTQAKQLAPAIQQMRSFAVDAAHYFG